MAGEFGRIRSADWDALERDVVTSIKYLRACAKGLDRGECDQRVLDMMARDLVLPNLRLLAHFCENVRIDDEQEWKLCPRCMGWLMEPVPCPVCNNSGRVPDPVPDGSIGDIVPGTDEQTRHHNG